MKEVLRYSSLWKSSKDKYNYHSETELEDENDSKKSLKISNVEYKTVGQMVIR